MLFRVGGAFIAHKLVHAAASYASINACVGQRVRKLSKGFPGLNMSRGCRKAGALYYKSEMEPYGNCRRRWLDAQTSNWRPNSGLITRQKRTI